jgi:hypothetical protein
MRKLCTFLTLLLYFGNVAFAQEAAVIAPVASPERTVYPIAIVPFESDESQLSEVSSKFDALFRGFISARAEFISVDRESVAGALEAGDVTNRSALDHNQVERLLKMTGARILVTGRIYSLRNEVVLVARVEDTEEYNVFGETQRIVKGQSPAMAAERLSEAVSRVVSEHQAAFREIPEQDLIEAVHLELQGKKLPAVAIAVEDNHVSELLQGYFEKAGFGIAGQHQAGPKIVISGEFYVDRGFRKGDLISKKGRISVRANRSGSGAVFYSEEQTEVATAPTREQAGELVMRRAALKVFSRIAPEIAK